MPVAPIPRNENDRLAGLRALEILDTPREEAFDRITRLVASIFEVPIAMISLVDEHRQWFKSSFGLNLCESPRAEAFCAYTILKDEPLIVPDSLIDERFADYPLVKDPGIRFYAGAPLITSDGHRVGALCAIDRKPRELTKSQVQILCDLANTTVQLMEARLAVSTARKQSTALTVARERFDMLSRATRDVVWDLQIESGEVWWNENVERAFGYSSDQIQNSIQWWTELIHPDDRERAERSFYGAIESDASNWKEEYRFRHSDGHYMVVLDRGHIIRDEDGRARRAVGAMFDITSQKRAAEQIAYQKSLLECQTEASLDAIVVTDQKNCIISYNRKFLEMWGLTEDVVQTADTETIFSLVSELARDQGGFTKRIEELLGSAEISATDLIELRDGRTLERYSEPVRDAHGADYGRVWYMRDVTQQKRIEQLLRDHNLVIEHSNVVLFRWKLEPGWPVELVSENISQFGYSAYEMLERRTLFADIVHPDDLERTAAEVNEFMASGVDRFEQEYRLICRDGDVRWIYDRTFVDRDESGKAVSLHGVVLDITDRKDSETRTQRLLHDLQERIKETQTLIRVLSLMHEPNRSVEETLNAIVKALPAAFRYSQATSSQIAFNGEAYCSPGYAPSKHHLTVAFTCEDGRSGTIDVSVKEFARPDGGDPFQAEEAQLVRTIAESLKSYLDRKRINEELRQHNIVIENSNTVLFRWRIADNWRVDTVSENVNQFGYSASELLSGSVTFATMVHQDDREWVERHVLECIKGGVDSIVQEYRIICRDSDVRWVYDRSTMERNASGEVTHLQGIVIDITDRKLAEQALRESEDRLRRIASQVPGAVYQFRLEPDGTRSFPYISDGIHNLSGITAAQLQSDPLLLASMVYPDDVERFELSIMESARTLLPWREEFRIHHHDGSVRWISGNSIPQRDPSGAIVWHGLIMDVSEQRDAENERRRLSAIVEASTDFIGLADGQGRAQYINRAGRALLGLGPNEPIDQTPISEFSPSWACEIILKEGLLVAERVGHWVGETALLTRDGREIPVSQLILAHKNADGEVEYFSTVMRDISMQRHAMAIEAERNQAEAASHAKSEFLAHMSHEIRSPMTAILGSAELLLDREQDESDRRNAVEVIRRNGSHLLAVINDILDLSKIEAGQMVVERITCSVPEIISEVASFTTARARDKGLHFEVLNKGPIPQKITTDPTRLRQILINLTGNAVKFTERGWVRLVVEMADPIDSANPRLIFKVADSGIGMAPEQIAGLFKPFVQADSSTTRRFGGTGLGLTISQRLAEALGGGIEVRSALGEGSVFAVTIEAGSLARVSTIDDLPSVLLLDDSEVPADAVACESSELRGRILLAEDAPDNQNILRAYLERAGLQVAVASNGRIACELVAKSMEGDASDQFDLILMDMQMPEMDGYEATATLRRNGFDQPIVALTAHAMMTDRDKCFSAGCNEYLAKPVKRAHLLDTVKKMLLRDRPAVQAATLTDDEEDEILNSFRASFISGLPEEVKELESALDAGRLNEIERIAHRLAGTTGMYQYDEISKRASNVEDLATTGAALESITDQVKELLELIRRVPGYDETLESTPSEAESEDRRR